MSDTTEVSKNKSVDVGKCSNIQSVFSMSLTAIGVGIITLPSIFARGGWMGGTLCIVLGVAIAQTTSLKLYRSLITGPEDKNISTYEDVGFAAYGKAGKVISGFVVHFTMIGVCSALLILLRTNMVKLVPSVSAILWVIIMGVFMCLANGFCRRMNHVGVVAAVGVVGVLSLMMVIFIAGMDRRLHGDEEHSIKYDLFFSSFSDFGTALGNSSLAFSLNNVVPTLVHQMKTPSAFPKVAGVSHLFIFLIYICIAGAGYAGWGELILHYSTVIDAIAPADMPRNVIAWLCIFSVLLTALSHYIVLFAPIAASAEKWLRVDEDSVVNATLKGGASGVTVKRWIVRSALVSLTVIIAIVVPNVVDLIDILGASTIVCIFIFFPIIFFLRIHQKNSSNKSWLGYMKEGHALEFLWLACLLLLGVFITIFGSIGAVHQLIKDS